MFLQSKKAFTIIEIMIIVAVIGIVIAVALPAYIRSGEINSARACQETMTRIEAATERYAIDTAKQSGDAVTMADLVKPGHNGYLEKLPHCPQGGAYSISKIGEAPVCSIGENPHATYAPHIYTTAVPKAN